MTAITEIPSIRHTSTRCYISIRLLIKSYEMMKGLLSHEYKSVHDVSKAGLDCTLLVFCFLLTFLLVNNNNSSLCFTHGGIGSMYRSLPCPPSPPTPNTFFYPKFMQDEILGSILKFNELNEVILKWVIYFNCYDYLLTSALPVKPPQQSLCFLHPTPGSSRVMTPDFACAVERS